MMLVFLILIFVIGTGIGSFLSVVLSRLNREKGIITGRSHCPACGQRLGWVELIPLLSYVFQKGKCRHCGRPISIKYFLLELASGSAAVIFILKHYPLNFRSQWLYLYLIFVFILLFFYDLEYFILPDKIIYPSIFLTAIYQVAPGGKFTNAIISALIIASFFAIIYMVSKGKWLGFGDVKLAFLIGLTFGWPWSAAVMVGAIWIGALTAIVLLAIGKATGKTPLPFGLFVSLASVIFILFDHEIIPFLAKFF